MCLSNYFQEKVVRFEDLGDVEGGGEAVSRHTWWSKRRRRRRARKNFATEDEDEEEEKLQEVYTRQSIGAERSIYLC